MQCYKTRIMSHSTGANCALLVTCAIILVFACVHVHACMSSRIVPWDVYVHVRMCACVRACVRACSCMRARARERG